MYNGIGLATARGSGTNGYVQRNTAFVMKGKDDVKFKTEEDIKRLDAAANREPNQGILDHERKRKLEVKCMELEEVLEEQGYAENEIEEKVSAYRKMLMSKEISKKAFAEVDEFGRPILKETHQIAEAQKEKNKQLKEAFGISEYFVEGSSFDPNKRALEDAAREVAYGNRKNDADIERTVNEKKKKKRHTSSESENSENERKSRKEKKKKKRKSRSSTPRRQNKGHSPRKERRRDDRDSSEDDSYKVRKSFKHRDEEDKRRDQSEEVGSHRDRRSSRNRDKRRRDQSSENYGHRDRSSRNKDERRRGQRSVSREQIVIKEESNVEHGRIQWGTNKRYEKNDSYENRYIKEERISPPKDISDQRLEKRHRRDRSWERNRRPSSPTEHEMDDRFNSRKGERRTRRSSSGDDVGLRKSERPSIDRKRKRYDSVEENDEGFNRRSRSDRDPTKMRRREDSHEHHRNVDKVDRKRSFSPVRDIRNDNRAPEKNSYKRHDDSSDDDDTRMKASRRRHDSSDSVENNPPRRHSRRDSDSDDDRESRRHKRNKDSYDKRSPISEKAREIKVEINSPEVEQSGRRRTRRSESVSVTPEREANIRSKYPRNPSSSGEKSKRRFKEYDETRNDRKRGVERSESPAREGLANDMQERINRGKADNKREYPESKSRGSFTNRRNDSNSDSSPSPARNRDRVDVREVNLTDRDRQKQLNESDEKIKLKSRQAPISTMRLYSQSPSPPPELKEWKREKKLEDKRVEERKEREENKLSDDRKHPEDDVVNAKPNNEKEQRNASDNSSNDDHDADDDVMKKIKALKKVEKILQKELEARRQKREQANSSSDSSSSNNEKTKKKKKTQSQDKRSRKKKVESSSDESDSTSEEKSKKKKYIKKENRTSSETSSDSEKDVKKLKSRPTKEKKSAYTSSNEATVHKKARSPPESYKKNRKYDSSSDSEDETGRYRGSQRRRRKSVDLDKVD